MDRRSFLRTAAASAASVAVAPLVFSQEGASPQRKRIPIGVQLYSVRNAANNDIAKTLEALAKMGYEGVEFYGGHYFGKEMSELRKMLDDNGLKCPSTHTGLGDLRNHFDRTVDIHKALGAQFIFVPGGLNRYYENVDTIKGIADEFNKLSEKARAVDMYIGYHAHGYDAVKVDGVEAWERFFDATVPEVLMQMDIGNYADGNGDPYRQIEKFKGRSKSVHLKEAGQRGPARPIIGEGTVDWPRVFELSETVGGVEWYIVEDELEPDSLVRIERSLAALREMRK